MNVLKLTREQRRQLLNHERPKIAGQGTCPVAPGHTIDLTRHVTFTVDEVRMVKGGGWSLRYTLTDRRDPARKLRRTPAAHLETGDRDEYGNPKPPTASEIARAARESAYTSGATSLADAGEAIDEQTQRRYTKEAHTFDELRERRRREAWQTEQDALSVLQRFALERERAERLGTDVHRELAALERTVANMRRKNNRRAA